MSYERPADHRRTLRRRLAHLERRLQEHQGDTGENYDRAEVAALRWALEALSLEVRT